MPIDPTIPPTVPRPDQRFDLAPLSGPPTPLNVLEALLKNPGRILYALQQGKSSAIILSLVALGITCTLVYGVVVGSLSGGGQLWIAPAKLALGTVASVLICLPSLYIFTCLNGADLKLRQIAGALVAAACLISLLLIGFAPVAWVFSQSTDSVAFMGFLHLTFWAIGVFFGLRLLTAMNRGPGSPDAGHIGVWACVFVIVCLQMTTALRPIIGTADHFLPSEKKFFVAHWLDVISKNPPARGTTTR